MLRQGGIFLGKRIHVNVSVVMMVMLPDRRFFIYLFFFTQAVISKCKHPRAVEKDVLKIALIRVIVKSEWLEQPTPTLCSAGKGRGHKNDTCQI